MNRNWVAFILGLLAFIIVVVLAATGAIPYTIAAILGAITVAVMVMTAPVP